MRMFQRQIIPIASPVAEGIEVHSIVRWIWAQINAQRASQEDIAERSGVSSSAMRKWRDGMRSPRLVELEAVVSTLGYRLTVQLKEDTQ